MHLGSKICENLKNPYTSHIPEISSCSAHRLDLEKTSNLIVNKPPLGFIPCVSVTVNSLFVGSQKQKIW